MRACVWIRTWFIARPHTQPQSSRQDLDHAPTPTHLRLRVTDWPSHACPRSDFGHTGSTTTPTVPPCPRPRSSSSHGRAKRQRAARSKRHTGAFIGRTCAPAGRWWPRIRHRISGSISPAAAVNRRDVRRRPSGHATRRPATAVAAHSPASR
jgi:hypothetical protein